MMIDYIFDWDPGCVYSDSTYVRFNGELCVVPPGINNKPVKIPESDFISKQLSELKKQNKELLEALTGAATDYINQNGSKPTWWTEKIIKMARDKHHA